MGVVGVMVACDVVTLAGAGVPGTVVPGAQAAPAWVPASVNGWIEAAMRGGEGDDAGPRLAEDGFEAEDQWLGAQMGVGARATASHLRRAGVAESLGGRVHMSFCTS